jgi:hypothetical protein
VIDGDVSQWVPVTSRVPQGSILGPSLFVIFINDLHEIIPNGTNTALYADDIKLYRSISFLTDCEGLQQALSNINNWSQHSSHHFTQSKILWFTITNLVLPHLPAFSKRKILELPYRLNSPVIITYLQLLQRQTSYWIFLRDIAHC